MARGEGPGWHHESRRHHDAAMKNRDRGRAHVVQDARRSGFKRKAGKRPIQNESQKFRQACRNTPPSQMEPCLVCGVPIPKQYTVCPNDIDDVAEIEKIETELGRSEFYKSYEDLSNYDLNMLEEGWNHLHPHRKPPQNMEGWRKFYLNNLGKVGVTKEDT